MPILDIVYSITPPKEYSADYFLNHYDATINNSSYPYQPGL